MNITPCEDCDNVHEQSRKQSPRSWLCVKFPRLENLNAVAPTLWVHWWQSQKQAFRDFGLSQAEIDSLKKLIISKLSATGKAAA